MGGAPRNPAPRNHFLVRIVKPSGCHCTDGHLTSGVFTEVQKCRRVPTTLRSTCPFSDCGGGAVLPDPPRHGLPSAARVLRPGAVSHRAASTRARMCAVAPSAAPAHTGTCPSPGRPGRPSRRPPGNPRPRSAWACSPVQPVRRLTGRRRRARGRGPPAAPRRSGGRGPGRRPPASPCPASRSAPRPSARTPPCPPRCPPPCRRP